VLVFHGHVVSGGRQRLTHHAVNHSVMVIISCMHVDQLPQTNTTHFIAQLHKLNTYQFHKLDDVILIAEIWLIIHCNGVKQGPTQCGYKGIYTPKTKNWTYKLMQNMLLCQYVVVNVQQCSLLHVYAIPA